VIFTSYVYIAFLAAVFLLHWTMPAAWRKAFLVLASYLFYCTWKWQFGFLLLGLSLFDWAYGRWVLPKASSRLALTLGIAANLSALLYFKYTNFILVNVAAAVQLFGGAWHPSVSDIILPLGISFFTFQGIAYLFDVATGEPPLTRLLDFLLFKALWPQLIAGPIVRVDEMRGQIERDRTIGYADFSAGAQRIVFGFFKKIVLADNLAPFVDMVFSSNSAPNMLDVAVGMLGFGLQIYFDFSAYSDIAIGSARLFGFVLPENFNWPYLATSPRDFWNRWHMTLSRWIRDYLFTPLTFAARRRPRLAPVWLLVAMALCGLWHGAQWTFVVWGLWHGALLVLNQTALRRVFPPVRASDVLPRWQRWLGGFLTFALVQAGWVVFRARSLSQAGVMLASILTLRGGLRPAIVRENIVLLIAVLLIGLLLAGGLRRLKPRLDTARYQPWMAALRPIAYVAMIVAIVVFDEESQAFVYFQF